LVNTDGKDDVISWALFTASQDVADVLVENELGSVEKGDVVS
jgi:hypothetical protein